MTVYASPADRRVVTASELRSWFESCGVTVSDWARENGFPRDVVYALLAGRTRGRRGVSHAAAVALGLKPKPQDVPALFAIRAGDIDASGAQHEGSEEVAMS